MSCLTSRLLTSPAVDSCAAAAGALMRRPSANAPAGISEILLMTIQPFFDVPVACPTSTPALYGATTLVEMWPIRPHGSEVGSDSEGDRERVRERRTGGGTITGDRRPSRGRGYRRLDDCCRRQQQRGPCEARRAMLCLDDEGCRRHRRRTRIGSGPDDAGGGRAVVLAATVR